MRVQELKASIKCVTACDDLKVRVDVWGQEKQGTRQVNAVGMCYTQTATLPPDHPPVNTFTGSRCHVLSQPQQIDWMTTEVKPVIEARLTDGLTLEYSRPMRTFTADDSTTTRFYDTTGKLTYNATTNPDPYAYAVVPDSYTQMDQLKLSGRINDDNRVYSYLMIGNTVNEEIDMNRWFNDMDVRWTNTSIEHVSLTTYGTIYNEDEQTPNLARLEELNPETAPSTLSQAVREPLDYHKSTAGLRGTWRPWGGGYEQGGLAIVGGYEYCDLQRLDAIYPLATSTLPLVPAGSVLDQSRTITNSFQIGPTYRWSSSFDTYLRYKYQDCRAAFGRRERLDHHRREHRHFRHLVAAARPDRGNRLQLVPFRVVHVQRLHWRRAGRQPLAVRQFRRGKLPDVFQRLVRGQLRDGPCRPATPSTRTSWRRTSRWPTNSPTPARGRLPRRSPRRGTTAGRHTS